MISKELSRKVLIIGTDFNGKGGIAFLLHLYSKIFSPFLFICSHRFTTKWIQLRLAIGAFFKLLYYCIFTSVEIVHIHTASYRSFYRESVYVLLAKFFRRKVVLHIHGGEFELFYNTSSCYVKFVCKKVDCLVCVSDYFREAFNRLNLNKNILVLYNAILPPICSKSVYDGGKIKISFLGTIDDNKGVFDIIKCMVTNKEYFRNQVELHIGGIGDKERLMSMVIEGKIADFVYYHGWLDVVQKNELLAKTDIYLQPSYFESLGIAIIEAMSYGIPVIASHTGGIPELVESSRQGYLIEPGDINQLYTVLRLLIENQSLREKLGRNSLEKSKKFSIETMEKNMVQLYNKLLKI
ncbi:glycosyltransferase family 4 protein [Butyricimonas sp.]|uniref:glycosyltransferase family 4 protein n=1 Tax=Butyricimonas sp. TaxID=1969738 RepID=UPI0025C2EB59|nr:glycosyltransferase family 4 protein [Butyricimonas sp.]